MKTIATDEALRGTNRMAGNPLDSPGTASRQAERAFAEREYKHYQHMRETHLKRGGSPGLNDAGKPTAPNFSKTVDAVEAFGVDPTGQRPIDDDIGSLPEDTLVTFPAGTFKIAGKLSLEATKAGMVGAGSEIEKPPSGNAKNTTTFVAEPGTHAAILLDIETGIFGSFVFDQTATDSFLYMRAGSSGFLYCRDVVWHGVVDVVGSQAIDATDGDYLCGIEAQQGATVRCTRFIIEHTGIPGTKNIGAKNPFWVGQRNTGVAQIEDCRVVGNASNGVYGGRTPGDVHIKGGFWKNNEVCQLRYAGRGSWADGVTLVIDTNEYSGPTGDSGGFNGQIGINGVKIERGDVDVGKAGGAVLRGADIRVKSVGKSGMGAPVLIRGSGGALKIENCRVVNHLSEASVVAEPSGGGYSNVSTSPSNITVIDSLFEGTNAESVINVHGRPNSLIRRTCFKIPGTSPDAVTGIRIGEGVGFGKICKAGGLKNPDQVGSAGHLLPVSFTSGSGGVSQQNQGPSKAEKRGVFVGVVDGIFMFLLILLGMVVVFVAGIVGMVGALAAMIGGNE